MILKIKPNWIFSTILFSGMLIFDYFILFVYYQENEFTFTFELMFWAIFLFTTFYFAAWIYPYLLAFFNWGYIVRMDENFFWDKRMTKNPIPWDAIEKIHCLHPIHSSKNEFTLILSSAKYARDFKKTMFRSLNPFQDSFKIWVLPLTVNGKQFSDSLSKYMEPNRVIYGLVDQ